MTWWGQHTIPASEPTWPFRQLLTRVKCWSQRACSFASHWASSSPSFLYLSLWTRRHSLRIKNAWFRGITWVEGPDGTRLLVWRVKALENAQAFILTPEPLHSGIYSILVPNFGAREAKVRRGDRVSPPRHIWLVEVVGDPQRMCAYTGKS